MFSKIPKRASNRRAKKHKRTRHSRPKGGLRRGEPPRQGKQAIELTLLETEEERAARLTRNLGQAVQQVREREAAQAAASARNPAAALARDLALLNATNLESDVLVAARTADQPTMVRAVETLGALGRSYDELNTRLIRHLNTMRNRHDRATHMQAAREIAPLARAVLTTGVGALPGRASISARDQRDWRQIHDALRTLAAHQGVIRDRSTGRWRTMRESESPPVNEGDPFAAAATVAAVLREAPRTRAFEGLRLVASPTDEPEDIVTEAARRQGRSPPPPGPGSGPAFAFAAPPIPPGGFNF